MRAYNIIECGGEMRAYQYLVGWGDESKYII